MSATSISKIHAREILDSRGNPTVEVEVNLAGSAFVAVAQFPGFVLARARSARGRRREPNDCPSYETIHPLLDSRLFNTMLTKC